MHARYTVFPRKNKRLDVNTLADLSTWENDLKWCHSNSPLLGIFSVLACGQLFANFGRSTGSTLICRSAVSRIVECFASFRWTDTYNVLWRDTLILIWSPRWFELPDSSRIFIGRERRGLERRLEIERLISRSVSTIWHNAWPRSLQMANRARWSLLSMTLDFSGSMEIEFWEGRTF